MSTPDEHDRAEAQRSFAGAQRSAILVTLASDGRPRPVPICFVLAPAAGDVSDMLLYSPLDEKPKSSPDVRRLARVRDIAARPEVTLLFERWSEDWSQLAWLRATGLAVLLERAADPAAHGWAVAALRQKYPQYQGHHLEAQPMIRVTLSALTGWSATGRFS